MGRNQCIKHHNRNKRKESVVKLRAARGRFCEYVREVKEYFDPVD